MNEAVSVKCPECGSEFPLGGAVLSSVRQGVARELESKLASREQALATSLAALDNREADLNKRTRRNSARS